MFKKPKYNKRKQTKLYLGERGLRAEEKEHAQVNSRLTEWMVVKVQWSGEYTLCPSDSPHGTVTFRVFIFYCILIIDQGSFSKAGLIRSQVTRYVIQNSYFLTLHLYTSCFQSKLSWWTAGIGLPCWKKDYKVISTLLLALSHEVTVKWDNWWKSSLAAIKYYTTI